MEIIEYENTLRKLIISILGSEDNAPYQVTESRLAQWKNSREIETKKRKEYNSEKRIIFYSEIYDLKNIIGKNWERFQPVLIDKKRFDVFFDEIEKFRNTTAHGRNLTASEESLAQGITLDLKNLITIYHNKNEMKDDYFIEIVKIYDNLGTVWEKRLHPNQPCVRVGDYYELVVEANDPKGREISYEVFTDDGFRIIQASNRFNIPITEQFISPSHAFNIRVSTPSSEYNNIARSFISITVLPEK